MTTVRTALLDSHDELLGAILACADVVVESWDGETTTDRRAVVGPFEQGLHRTGILERLPAVLVDVAGLLGEDLPSEPVAAPPYVAVTSVGPVLRATLSTARLVITVRAFEIERDPTRYVRGADVPSEALDVAFRSR